MKRMDVAITAASDVGRKRPHNEDSHAVWMPDDSAERERRGVLLVVADGMGGMLAGDVASRLAVETVVKVISESPAQDLLADLKAAIEEANRVMHDRSRSHPDLSGMGTTCTAVILCNDRAWIGHVGDSRAYLIRGDVIRQLTKDHSLVAYLVERRELTQEQARRDPRRNVVTRSIGPQEEVEVDTLVSDTTLRPGDNILVCSDGLHGPITDADLADVVANEDHATVCDRLIAEANDRGGPDNITVVVAKLVSAESGSPAAAPADEEDDARTPALSTAFSVHPLLLVLFAATLVLACVMWFLNRQNASM